MNNRFLLIVCTVFITCVLISIKIKSNRISELYKRDTKTIGVINVQGKNFEYFYVINGIQYSARNSIRFYGMLDGEKYWVYYDVEDPSFSYLSSSRPYIDDSLFAKTCSLSKDYNYKKGSRRISYKYVVDGNVYSRVNDKVLKSDLKVKKASYLVKYMITNPRISYIFEDSLCR